MFELVRNVNDLIPIIQKYLRLIEEEKSSYVFQRFITFTYWYYFPYLNAFVPNKFLGYKNHAVELYKPKQGDGRNGGRAREALEPYFTAITDEKKHKELYDKLQKFAKGLGKIRKNVIIYELKEEYHNLFNNDEFEINVPSKNNDKQRRNNQSNYIPKKALLIKKDTPYQIKERIQDLIIQINKNCTNFKKAPIFNDSNTLEIWRKIETITTNENDFHIFSGELYKLLYETTRSKNPKFNKNRDNRKSFYIYRLPDEFLKYGTPTKYFMDIVSTLRHKHAHTEPEYKELKNKLTFPDIIEKLKIDKSPVDYANFQIEILKLFENSMKELIKIVEKKINCPKNP
ncbi:MAG: hypothetical protein LBH44_09895 [Treponema sp.]|jgi:hypothetical protein|nr:hypothetical protein [Treponema sp.]